MKFYLQRLLVLLLFFATPLVKQTSAQSTCQDLDLQFVGEHETGCNAMTMSMLHDQQGRPYLYLANKDAGFTVLNIATPQAPVSIETIPIDSLEGLHVMSLTQTGDYVYAALGDFFAGDQHSGVAIFNVSDPQNPVLTDVWKFGPSTEGAGMVVAQGDYAYICAMSHGLIILDVQDKENVQFVSQLVPNLNFPDPTPDVTKINARGLVVKDDLVYMAYDAGGLRIIDVQDRENPKERGMYSNPELDGRPRAYNNLVLDDTLVYMTIDYCGLEVLNVSDTANIELVGWWNPWGCPNNNWFTSVGHTNEIAFDEACKTVFMSTGKSEMYAVSVADPTAPDSCGVFGATDNGLGTWGVSAYENQVFLSYICTWGIPFQGTWSGVKLLSYNNTCTTSIDENESSRVAVYPNPASGRVTISSNADVRLESIEIRDVSGRTVHRLEKVKDQAVQIDTTAFSKGTYFITLTNKKGKVYHKQLIVEK